MVLSHGHLLLLTSHHLILFVFWYIKDDIYVPALSPLFQNLSERIHGTTATVLTDVHTELQYMSVYVRLLTVLSHNIVNC
jgi:hypothetical protein